AILAQMRWSVVGDIPASPPATSLYHGLVSDVQWPYSTLGNAGIDLSSIRVAVGNTSVDALAALIQAEAQAEAQQDPNDSTAWRTAGNNLAGLTDAAMYALLDDAGTPGGPHMAASITPARLLPAVRQAVLSFGSCWASAWA